MITLHARGWNMGKGESLAQIPRQKICQGTFLYIYNIIYNLTRTHVQKIWLRHPFYINRILCEIMCFHNFSRHDVYPFSNVCDETC